MIPAPPPGWTQRFSANLVVYEAPDGGSRIRCHQQMPLEPISRVVARIAGGARIEETKRVVSGEGEYAALCRVAGERVVAALFADADAIVIEGSARHADVVLDLLTRWKLELGVRPRRALYVPPPGWRPMPNALATTWYPPGFPQLPFALSDISMPEPDLAVIPRKRWGDPHPSTTALLIEVAESSLRVDRGLKARLYAEASVIEYWVVNVGRLEIEVHRDPVGSQFTSVSTCDRHAEIRPLAFPELVVCLDAVIRSAGD